VKTLLKSNFSWALASFFIVSLPFLTSAQEAAPVEIKVSEAVIATQVENLIPQGAAETFPSSVGRLFAFSRITGIKVETEIKHLWFYGDQLKAEITLPVKPMSWRTFSSKKILPQWTGEWKVDITTQDGLLLESLPFTIE
jgi:hypothetical protein